MKRIISLLLSVLLILTVFTALPMSAGAAQSDAASTAQGEQHYIYVEYGTAYSVETGEAVQYAAAGEKIKVVPDRTERFQIFRSYYSDDVVLDATDWSFTMPDDSVGIYMNYDLAQPMDFDLTSGSAAVTDEQYAYLVDCITSNKINGYKNFSGDDMYDIILPDNTGLLLERGTISSYDHCDYAPSYSLMLMSGSEYNPINFIFADNEISYGEVDLTMPADGDEWDETVSQAEMSPAGDDADDGHFTVSSAAWYNSEGSTSFTAFKGNELYCTAFVLTPEDGYYFTLNSRFTIHVQDYDRDIDVYPVIIKDDGSAYFYPSDPSEMIRLIGGTPHSIDFTNAYAAHRSDRTPITEAVPGEAIFVRPDWRELDDSLYIVMGSARCTSDDVEVIEAELVDTFYFYMPDYDVTGVMTYETEEQMHTVLPLYNGDVTVSGNGSQRSESFGVSRVFSQKAANRQTVDEDAVWYDIDGDDSWDIQLSGTSTYSLLATNSLTQNVKLTLSREESARYPVRDVTIQVVKPVMHTITIVGDGVATSRSKDYANNYVITEAEEGATVYVYPNYSKLKDDYYLVQTSAEAYSDDVEVFCEGPVNFIMPDHDVTVTYTFERALQDISIFDFRYENTVTMAFDGTGPKSEAYGVSMVLRLASASYKEESDSVYLYDVDGNGSYDIKQDRTNNTEDVYTLLDTSSLPDAGVTLTLTREQSWTLPIRTLYIYVKPDPIYLLGDVDGDEDITTIDVTLIKRYLANMPYPDTFSIDGADVDGDGDVTILDVTLIQRYLANMQVPYPIGQPIV